MLPSVRELLAFCDQPPKAAPVPTAAEPQAAVASTPDGPPADEQLANIRQRPGRKAGCTDRHSVLSGSRPYRCGKRNCGAVFKRPEHLKRHILVHTQERPFHCSARGCGKRFSRRDNYITHTKKHDSGELSPADVAFVRESSSLSAADSKRAASDAADTSVASTRPGTPTAVEPQRTDTSISGLLNQEDGPRDAGWSSSPSEQSESAELGPLQSLDLLAFASTRAKMPLQPSAQDASEAAVSAPKRIRAVLEQPIVSSCADNPAKPFKCPMCDVCFGRLEHVKRHQLVHTGERQFKCPTCKKTFARKDNMVQHVRAHERKGSAALASA
ncbi:hypothetical protein LPJ63_000638 [Coemansia sp. RSA 2711]|nr:hypothetical protein LPJ63_000638 [Coemansia sp. RSA 2711]KAJ2364702.1 hypothetical protein H4S01_003636 [Coemansia sp. RSA 2610]KAJ2385953.1 hypothetical protein H4S02_004081 [Coemansia sp. RSA 2611]